MNKCGLCGVITNSKEEMIKHYENGECSYYEDSDND